MPTYTYPEARERLLNHASLASGAVPEEQSLSCRLWKAERDGVAPPLELAADVIACLQVANLECNGPNPSIASGPAGRRNRAVIEELSYALSGLTADGLQFHLRWSRRELFSAAVRDDLERAVYLIAFAWSQLQAGDVDDLIEGAEVDLD